MPVKEIITYVLGVIGALAVLHGPLHLKDELWKVEVQILRETARTDNWGNPSLFAHRRPIHAVPSFSCKQGLADTLPRQKKFVLSYYRANFHFVLAFKVLTNF